MSLIVSTTYSTVQEQLQDGLRTFQEVLFSSTFSIDNKTHALLQSPLPFPNQSKVDEWHKLVTEDFRNSLPKTEITRQSVIFEVIKSEKIYVGDVSPSRPLFDCR